MKSFGKHIRGVAKGKYAGPLKETFDTLKQIEIHYQRKENQLFPLLERKAFTGPSQVMWGKHDEIRGELRQFNQSLKEQDWESCKKTWKVLQKAMKRMIFMEEKILFPTSMKKLTEEDWIEIRKGESEIGYAWVKPGNLWDPSVAMPKQAEIAPTDAGSPEDAIKFHLDVGELLEGEVNLLLKNLPVDITYVDGDDKVIYYSQGIERIFPRSPAIIGRSVQKCHPPKSVHIVEQIITAFKKKEKKTADFWLNVDDRLIYIRYFPLYLENGEYAGVIEVSQDITEIQALQGERRLLDWGDE